MFLLRGVFGALLAMAVMLSWPHLAHHIAWQDYREMVEEIRQGRFLPADEAQLGPLLAQDLGRGCLVLRDDTLLMLHFYVTELHAYRAGVNPFLPADDPALTERLATLFDIAQKAAACAPMDGSLWVELAVIARALDLAPEQVARYLALSEQYAPYEGWIMRRRTQYF